MRAQEILREYNSHEVPSDWRTVVAMRFFAKFHVERVTRRLMEINHIGSTPKEIDEITKTAIENLKLLEDIK